MRRDTTGTSLFGPLVALLGGGLMAFLVVAIVVIGLNLALLAAGVWVVVSVLQGMGVL